MVLVQLTGLSGSGKTTIAKGVKELLEQKNFKVEIIDGDIYRRMVCPDLGFSKEDRIENIRRLGFVGNRLASHGIIAILAAINPYEEMRQKLREYGPHVLTVWINCDLEALIERDTKGLYKRAMLPEDHPEKINNLTGMNDPFEIPQFPDLVLHTHRESEAKSVESLFHLIIQKVTQA